MERLLSKPVIQAIGLGNVAGIRSMVAPSIVSDYFSSHQNINLYKSRINFMQSPMTSAITKALSMAEFAGDKLPGTPDRIILPQVLGRIASGALVGATIFQANRESIIKGAVIGGVAALAATYASFFARKFFGEMFSLKNSVAGAIEDALAVGGGAAIMRI